MSKIFDFVKPGVITGDDVQKVFQVAKENNFALPAVNCVGTDSINAVLETAAKVKAPVIVQFSNGGAAFIAGKGVKTDVPQGAAILGAISGAHHVHQMAEHYGVPVILHTDHCAKKLLPWIDGLLDAGEKHFAATGKPLFSSHMIDLSEESLHENIEICSKYLARMSKMGMTLEIELGCTGGEEDGVDNSHMDASAAVAAWDKLTAEGVKARVVSMPSTDAFDKQDAAYRESVLPKAVTARVAVEAGIADYWFKYVGLNGAIVGMTTFGESAPAEQLFEEFGFTVDNVVAKAKALL